MDSAESQREGHWPLQTHQAHTQQNGVIQPTSLHDNVARPPPATLPAPAPAPVVAPPQGDANPVVPAVAQYQQSVAKTHRPAEMNGAAAHVAPPVPDSAASVHTVVSAPRPQETQVPLDVPRSVPSDVPPPVVRPNSRRPESGSGPAQSTIPQRDSSVETPSPVPTADGMLHNAVSVAVNLLKHFLRLCPLWLPCTSVATATVHLNLVEVHVCILHILLVFAWCVNLSAVRCKSKSAFHMVCLTVFTVASNGG